MARPRKDPMSLDTKELKVQLPISLRERDLVAVKKAWEAAKASGEQATLGAWVGARVAAAIASGMDAAPAQGTGAMEGTVVLNVDTDRLARSILETLLPELSDTLRRTAAGAMERVGKTTALTLGQALQEAVSASMPAVGEAAGEAAARSATLTLLPEARRIAAAAEALTQPLVTPPEQGRRH